MKRLPTIRQLEDKQNIHEFASSDISAIQKYLNLTEEDKKKYLYTDFWYTWDSFSEEQVDVGDHQVNDYEDAEGLPQEIIDNWNDWIYDQIEDGNYRDIGIDDADVPTWAHMNFIKILRNKWLVHLTDNADGVVKDGFIYGVDNIDKLGLTTYMGDFDKSYGGYNFAYDINDVERFGISGNGYKYGSEAVFFRASGAKISHYGDEEDQVIFYGKTATDRIPAYKGDDGWELRSTKTDEIIVTKDNLGQLGEWIEKNFAQYSKSLIS